MEETYPLALAVFDFVPNLAFLAGAYFLVQLVRRERSSRCAHMLTAGTLLIFLAGTFKATWKLLYTLELADLKLLSEQQFVLSSVGFAAMLIAIIFLARAVMRARPVKAPGMLAIAVWKIPLMAVMVISSLGAQGLLAFLAFRRGSRLAGALFVLAIVCMLGMAGMASGEQTVARQWIEEGVNTLGQVCFAVGAFRLNRSGCR